MPSWPNTLPQFALESGYQEDTQDQTIETQMEAGPAKIRRRFTKEIRTYEIQMMMTQAQAAAFDTFWQTDCLGGSISFDWVNPRTRAATTFRFRLPAPRRTVFGGSNVLVSFKLERL